MYDKQILARSPQSPDQVPSPSRSSEKQLMELWFSSDINESYQGIVLGYLDGLPKMNQWFQIQKQFKNTLERRTYFYRISNLSREREKLIKELELEVIQFDEWSYKIETKYPRLEDICDLIDQIRKNSMIICEEVTAMFQKYKYDPEKTPALGSHYLVLFRDFNSSLKFLKDSYLTNYIPFSDGYDPLFVQVLKYTQSRHQSNSLQYDYSVKELFDLNASYMYRLLRGHQKMLLYSNLSYKAEKEDSLSFDYTYRGEPKEPDSPIRESFQGQRFKNVAEIEIKDPRIMKKQSIEKLPKPVYQTIQPSAPLESHKDETIQKTRKIQSLPKREVPKVTKQSSLDPSKGEIFEIQHLSQTLQKSRQKVPSSNRAKTIENQLWKMTPNQKRYNTISKKQSAFVKNINLPKLSKVNLQTHSHHLQETECFCRKKYKNHKNKESFVEISEGDYEERRKTIIRTVRQKYRELAKKEIHYQLSKLGDRTYHHMKSRFVQNK